MSAEIAPDEHDVDVLENDDERMAEKYTFDEVNAVAECVVFAVRKDLLSGFLATIVNGLRVMSAVAKKKKQGSSEQITADHRALTSMGYNLQTVLAFLNGEISAEDLNKTVGIELIVDSHGKEIDNS